MIRSAVRRARRAAPVLPALALALVACGSDPAAPGPFAELAGEYRLVTVSGAPLPHWDGYTWLFERRVRIHDSGLFETFNMGCTPRGEECPRRTWSGTARFERAGDGTLFLSVNVAYVEPDGALIVAQPTAGPHLLLRYERY